MVNEQTTQAAAPAKPESEPAKRRTMTGRVTSDKMDKTAVVEVVKYAPHAVYKKYVRTRTRFKAHDEKNECKIGDQVEIVEHRPLSREKRWKVARIIKRAVVE